MHEDGRLAAERRVDDTMRHAEVIGGMIRDCLAEASGSAESLTAVVAGMGPGPFTGLRVGIAAARVFALGRSLPLLPVVSHDAIAFEHYGNGASGRILVVTDARRRELYWSVFNGPADGPAASSGIPVRVSGPYLAAPRDVPTGPHRVDAARVSAAALGALAARMRAAGVPFAANDALYLRSPDVTPSRAPKRVS